MNYYNEFDPEIAAWLRELIRNNLIAYGEVDERSIEDVVPSDLKGFTQCHFFAGIGGWSYALRLAGWPDDKPIWTGSCPCQPFSTAGQGAGLNDKRHLWPAWFHLIKQCGPAIIFGEQVASKNTGPWFDLVQVDVESMGYAFGCVPFPAAGIGSPQIRERAYWVAHSESFRDMRKPKEVCGEAERQVGANMHQLIEPSYLSYWAKSDWLAAIDGRERPIESGTFPVAYGIPERMVRQRGYGNAINPYAAKAFIEATQEALGDLEAPQAAVAA